MTLPVPSHPVVVRGRSLTLSQKLNQGQQFHVSDNSGRAQMPALSESTLQPVAQAKDSTSTSNSPGVTILLSAGLGISSFLFCFPFVKNYWFAWRAELQRNKGTIRCAAQGAEVPGQCQKQLTQTLILRLLKSHFTKFFLDCKKYTRIELS